jgi:hypothetical protein
LLAIKQRNWPLQRNWTTGRNKQNLMEMVKPYSGYG